MGVFKKKIQNVYSSQKLDDHGTSFDYFGSGGCGYVLLNLKGGNPLEGDGDPYPSWPSTVGHTYFPYFWVMCAYMN